MEHRLKIEASTTGKKGTIRIVDRISVFTDSSASSIRDIIDDFLIKDINDVAVYINSRGGSTIEATEIVNELQRVPKINVTIGALAASAATYISAHYYTQAYANSQLMIHRPTMNVLGDVKQIKADLKMLENTNEDYKQVYAAKMNKSHEEIEALFEKGDYWMTAAEALKMRLIDQIINSDSQITAEDVERLTACGAPTIPNLSKKTETKIKHELTMKNRDQIVALLKLSADATDEQIQEAIAKSIAVSAEVGALREAQATALSNTVNELVDKAIFDKKITADVKEKYVKLGLSDPESTKAILEAMPVITKLSAELEPDKTQAATREKWTLEEYLEKDPQALDTLEKDNPQKFTQLQEDYFKK